MRKSIFVVAGILGLCNCNCIVATNQTLALAILNKYAVNSINSIVNAFQQKIIINEELNSNSVSELTSNFCSAIKDGDHVKVANLIRVLGSDINSRDRGGYPPIYYAIQIPAKCFFFLGHLINYRADVNISYSYDNSTPLHTAVSLRNIDAVKMLLTVGTDVNAVNIFGETPLDLARANKFIEVEKLLLESEAQPGEMKAPTVQIEFLRLVSTGSIKKVRGSLEDPNLDINYVYGKDIKRNKPCIAGFPPINCSGSTFIKASENPDYLPDTTALHLAIAKYDIEIVRTLVDNGAIVSEKDKELARKMKLDRVSKVIGYF